VLEGIDSNVIYCMENYHFFIIHLVSSLYILTWLRELERFLEHVALFTGALAADFLMDLVDPIGNSTAFIL